MHACKTQLIQLLVIAGFFIASCSNETGAKNPVRRDSTITPASSFNHLFLDSVVVDQFITNHQQYKLYQKQYDDFYKQRNYQYAWFDTSGITEQANGFMNFLSSTIDNLDDSSLYNEKLFELYNSYVVDSIPVPASPLETELLLTGQFFACASRVYKGTDIDVTELGWYIPKKKTDFAVLLDSMVTSKGKYRPLNSYYLRLQNILSKYRSIDKSFSWDSIAKPSRTYKQGDSSRVIANVKQRFFLLGDLKQQDSSAVFDKALFAAVKSFQRRMGLKETGRIDSKVVDELNTPIDERIKEMLINLERMRWMPADAGSNYILVNIPDYKLFVFDSSKVQFSLNVIVGKAATSTVIFTGNLQYIVFSPYWNVPYSIAKNEVLPGMRRSSGYLRRNNMEVTGYIGKVPIVRQKPGKNNSLGLVKFLFPNSYNIYLHDTPNRGLFSEANRGFSHGCIRVQNPQKLAIYLLRNVPSYTPKTIDSCMHLSKEKWVTLDNPIPVYIAYFTAWVDRYGQLNFRKDIYGHDKKMSDKLFVKN